MKFASILAFAAAAATADAQKYMAKCQFQAEEDGDLEGNFIFQQRIKRNGDETYKIVGGLESATDGETYTAALYETFDTSDCANADGVTKVMDLNDMTGDAEGAAELEKMTDAISLTGETSYIGYAVLLQDGAETPNSYCCTLEPQGKNANKEERQKKNGGASAGNFGAKCQIVAEEDGDLEGNFLFQHKVSKDGNESFKVSGGLENATDGATYTAALYEGFDTSDCANAATKVIDLNSMTGDAEGGASYEKQTDAEVRLTGEFSAVGYAVVITDDAETPNSYCCTLEAQGRKGKNNKGKGKDKKGGE